MSLPPGGFLLDIDGTTLLGPDPLPGAVDFITELRARGIPHVWLTNNTSRSRQSWLGRLEAAGLSPQPHELYTAAAATIDHLKALSPAPRIYVLGTPEFEQDLEDAGLHIDADDPNLVLVAFDQTLTYAKLARANLLLERGLPFYATHPDKTCPTPEGPIPDVGSFLALFEASSGRRPIVIGKPEPTMIEGALRRLGCDRSEVIVVGDRPETDIRMANRARVRSFLVLSGVTSAEDLPHAADQPSRVLLDLAAVQDAVLGG